MIDDIADLKSGDRVVITDGRFDAGDDNKAWRRGSTGTVVGTGGSSGFCGRDSDFVHTLNEGYVVRVRFDDFDYGPSPSNCHTVCRHILSRDEVPAEEVEAAIQSILGGTSD